MRMSNRRLILLLALVLFPALAAIVSRTNAMDRAGTDPKPMYIKVDLSERLLRVYEGGKVVKTYGVAIGTKKHPTPTGTFRTGRIEWNPRWIPPDSWWARNERPRNPGDPKNPMQGVKIDFREPAYFIHGTNAPGSIGSAASHGCLRMEVSQAKSLARRIQKHGSVRMLIVP